MHSDRTGINRSRGIYAQNMLKYDLLKLFECKKIDPSLKYIKESKGSIFMKEKHRSGHIENYRACTHGIEANKNKYRGILHA